MRQFVVLGHRAVTAPVFTLKDLPGTGGRMDVMARSLTQAFLTSHGLREDTRLYLVLMGHPTPPKTLRVTGSGLRYLNPDERSTAKLLEKALGTPTTGKVWQAATPGVEVAQRGLLDLREELEGAALYRLDDHGKDVQSVEFPENAAFFIGDDQGFTEGEVRLLGEWGATPVCLGPVSLHADQCVTVVHNLLDRREGED